MTDAPAQDSAQDTVEEILEDARAERDRIEAELREINTKLEQSRGELERLAKNNAQVTAELKNLERDFEGVPRASIKEVYEAAYDAQQRLYVMRGQVDKLQADQANLRRYGETLKALLRVASEGGTGSAPVGDESEFSSKSTVVRIIEAQERERQRLAGQMHDGPAQSLTNFILQAEICQRLFDKDTTRARDELTNLKTSASSTFQKVRDFIFDLRPMMLDDLGLVPTLRRYVEAFQEKGTITTNLMVSGEDRRLEAHREVIIFRALQELMANVRDHASATEVTISLDMGRDEIRASVEDNGRGIGTDELVRQPGQHDTLGLATMRERVALIDGQMDIEAGTGQGSRIVITIPAGPPV